VVKSANLAYRHQKFSKAVTLYERLLKESKDEEAKRIFLARLVMVASKVDATLAAKYAAKLPPMPGLDKVSAKILEAQPPKAKLEDKTKDQPSSGDKKLDEEQVERMKKRKEKRRLKKERSAHLISILRKVLLIQNDGFLAGNDRHIKKDAEKEGSRNSAGADKVSANQ